MTRRERLLSKLEKRREWAEKRQAAFSKDAQAAIDMLKVLPMGQPILIGHHSERRHRALLARSDSAMSRAHESKVMAEHHEQKAEGLAAQLESTIFSDDENAVEALKARIASLEAERERIKKYNASCRKGKPDLSILDDKQKKDIESIIRINFSGKMGQFPQYVSANLSGNIKRNKDRILDIERRAKNAQYAKDQGGVLITRSGFDNNWATIIFAEKPDYSIIKDLKAAKFRWCGGRWGGSYDDIPQSVLDLKAELSNTATV